MKHRLHLAVVIQLANAEIIDFLNFTFIWICNNIEFIGNPAISIDIKRVKHNSLNASSSICSEHDEYDSCLRSIGIFGLVLEVIIQPVIKI